ncbi:dTMP kinase [Ferroacidibacillus organovorans]|uniref:Thymidylate kinase n=1 Tax=Ferroacidibacillus organovorans TaxID=1765683 RepID=A0A162TLN5_9BACL|nr:dTMP kinase [Ferroacidibacillus organovorans]KYP80926.1 thymidylate kinase [Ferroacidibacillus organovorans]OAG95460.1 thymidylate kinase [Ferroacidibacillus organovorans]OPG15801.1 dTMP kinase [Ferroacidibacillus organovorans]
MDESKKTYYGAGLPYLKDETYAGKLIVIEGADCSGRSTQAFLLKQWLEYEGHAVMDTGIKRSTLVSGVIDQAKEGNVLGKTTLSLLYATDFADQLENKIIPALRAGFIVLADRYIFTLMVRDAVRGADPDWLEELFGFARIPDLTFYLHMTPEVLLHRHFQKRGVLDYWESGMDLSLSTDMFESFHRYQSLCAQQFEELAEDYHFVTLDGTRAIEEVQETLRTHVSRLIRK